MNLLNIIKDYQLDYNENKTHYILKCPMCSKEKLYIDKEKHLFICFRCGIKGGATTLITYLKNISYSEASRLFYGERRVGIELDEEFFKILDDIHYKLKEKNKKQKIIYLPNNCHPISFYNENDDVYIYLKNRDITSLHNVLFDIGYSSLLNRVIFPIFYNYELVGWQARAIYDEQAPKILNNTGFVKSNYLYNYDTVKNINVKNIILTEGIIDCIKANDILPSIAIFGKTISQKQLNFIIELGLDKIYIGLDPDAKRQSENIAQKLKGFINNVFILDIPENRDLGDSSMKEIKEYIQNSKKIKNFIGVDFGFKKKICL